MLLIGTQISGMGNYNKVLLPNGNMTLEDFKRKRSGSSKMITATSQEIIQWNIINAKASDLVFSEWRNRQNDS